jgi:hypothetical protein
MTARRSVIGSVGTSFRKASDESFVTSGHAVSSFSPRRSAHVAPDIDAQRDGSPRWPRVSFSSGDEARISPR